jgi:hypothetical protein
MTRVHRFGIFFFFSWWIKNKGGGWGGAQEGGKTFFVDFGSIFSSFLYIGRPFLNERSDSDSKIPSN